MRYLDILHVINENRQQYLQMLQPLVTLGLTTAQQAQYIANEIRKKLKRNDRIVWWLRNYKLYSLQDYTREKLKEYVRDDSLTDEQFKQKEDQLLALFKKITGRDFVSIPTSQTTYFFNEFGIESQTLNHYVGMFDLSPNINNIQWDPDLDLNNLVTQLGAAETLWRERQKTVVSPRTGDKIVIDYGNTAWVLLPRESCDDEGKAMGHCGNTGDPRPGDRILSYRTKEPDSKHRPHLTFVLQRDGYLGEMKGRNNQKPDSKYHRVIIDLLKNEMVKGIRGGGYKPENNFQIEDLPENIQDELIDTKPTLASLNTLYRRQGMTDDIKQQIETVIAEYTTIKPRWLDEQKKMVLGPFKKFSKMSELIWGSSKQTNAQIFTKIVDSFPVRTADDEQDPEEELSDQTRKQIRQLFAYDDDANWYLRESWNDVYKALNSEDQYTLLMRKIGLNPSNYYSLSDLWKKSPRFKQAYDAAVADAFADHVYGVIRGMLAQWLEKNQDKVYKIRNYYSVALDYSRAVDKTQEIKNSEYPPPSLWFFLGPHPGHKFPATLQKINAQDIVEKLFKELK